MFVLMGVLGLVIFWDYRGALVGAVYSAGLSYLWLRPGGIGYRVEAHQQKVLEERGDVGVRVSWLIRALVIVLLVLVGLALIIYLIA